MLECVVNISEGRNRQVVAEIAVAAGDDLLDVHTDPHHHRSVLTLVGEDAPRAVTEAALERIDIDAHRGVHPRIGAVDVVPFVPLSGSTLADAVAARDRFGRWAGELGIPSFLYGPERSLPEIRRGAFSGFLPAFGPPTPQLRAGAIALGARLPLIAWNLWLETTDLAHARAVAAAIRGPRLRTLGLRVGNRIQLSMNLIDPLVLGPDRAHDLAAAHTRIAGAELVGLLPRAVLDAIPRSRWAQLDLDQDRTIEARLARTGR